MSDDILMEQELRWMVMSVGGASSRGNGNRRRMSIHDPRVHPAEADCSDAHPKHEAVPRRARLSD